MSKAIALTPRAQPEEFDIGRPRLLPRLLPYCLGFASPLALLAFLELSEPKWKHVERGGTM